VNGFDQLHPALQHHIVNSLGWRELRPFQEAVVPDLLAGKHIVVLAPTAGGKTEAVFFPMLSRMLADDWSPLSVLYLCPIKALLNNLDLRLQRYCSLVGRRSALWHGDVSQAARRRILREPPDCLLTTPESLEVMLVSPNVDAQSLFRNLRAVVVDEIHAFAGDDRGWHLLAVLERAQRLAGRELQRIGLSATVGNPEQLADWLAGSCTGQRGTHVPKQPASVDADVQLDYVGSLENAAVVISRLHRGEKRLVFLDSRARAERLAAELRRLHVTTFITHSSLSVEQRHQAEEAFATRSDCVIIATSVLELGVDVGDLDRVIQIDSPSTVASFLQRMGRTGRRKGFARNCLFLATKEDTLVQAAALIDLWASEFVEPVIPPALPYHVVAQQLMALALQLRGVERSRWFDWIRAVPGFAAMPAGNVDRLVAWMLEHDILWDDEGILWLGHKGEETYGRRNFLELFSVFMSPPLFTVLYGRQEIGFVDELSFLGKRNGPHVILLGGRAWHVTYVDWQRRAAFVEPSDAPGRSRWQGAGQGLGFALCQAIKCLLATDDQRTCWSRRATEAICQVRRDFAWLTSSDTAFVTDAAGTGAWWTFAGSRANATLAHTLAQRIHSRVDHDSFQLTFTAETSTHEIEAEIIQLKTADLAQLSPAVDEQAVNGLKFSHCLPPDLAQELLAARLCDTESLRTILAKPVRFVTV
jgi:ATP-dependent Lhr-like helicase